MYKQAFAFGFAGAVGAVVGASAVVLGIARTGIKFYEAFKESDAYKEAYGTSKTRPFATVTDINPDISNATKAPPEDIDPPNPNIP